MLLYITLSLRKVTPRMFKSNGQDHAIMRHALYFLPSPFQLTNFFAIFFLLSVAFQFFQCSNGLNSCHAITQQKFKDQNRWLRDSVFITTCSSSLRFLILIIVI